MELTDLAIDSIKDLVQAGEAVIELEGRHYANRALAEVKPAKLSLAEPLALSTLDGLRGLLAQMENSEIEDAVSIVHVVSPSEVRIVSDIVGPHRQRECVGVAAPLLKPFVFDRYGDLEAFIIAAQAQFVQTPGIAQVLKLVGNIKDENVTQTSDDGVSQGVTARVGIARVENVTVPNPVTLAPYRTFPEVAQPESKFVLRLQSGVKDGSLPTVGLWEADGGAWRVAAMASITEWLKANLPDGTRIIG